jgi:hypothetical protein
MLGSRDGVLKRNPSPFEYESTTRYVTFLMEVLMEVIMPSCSPSSLPLLHQPLVSYPLARGRGAGALQGGDNVLID